MYYSINTLRQNVCRFVWTKIFTDVTCVAAIINSNIQLRRASKCSHVTTYFIRSCGPNLIRLKITFEIMSNTCINTDLWNNIIITEILKLINILLATAIVISQ